MPDFDHAFDILMRLEVGDDPAGGFIADDNGAGACRWGFTQNKLDSIGEGDYAHTLTRERAKELAHTFYWKRFQLDRITWPRMAATLLAALFNREAFAEQWQCSVGVRADGKIGHKTISATNNCETKWLPKTVVYEALLTNMEIVYRRLVVENPARHERFLGGWISRVDRTKSLTLEAFGE